jgi:soluble lytic murein transglycosylase-like protein
MTVKDAVAAAAAKYALDPALLSAQVLVESSGDPFAFRFEKQFFDTYVRDKSAAKAVRFGPLAACSYGPLQILLEVACELGFTGYPEELFNPAIGVDWGAKYLASLLAWAKGDYAQAFAAYNGGKVGNNKVPLRNQAYVDRVMGMKGKPLTT